MGKVLFGCKIFEPPLPNLVSKLKKAYGERVEGVDLFFKLSIYEALLAVLANDDEILLLICYPFYLQKDTLNFVQNWLGIYEGGCSEADSCSCKTANIFENIVTSATTVAFSASAFCSVLFSLPLINTK